MEKQNNCKYCPFTTQQHYLAKTYSQYVEEINDVMFAEGEKKKIFKNEFCINLDKIELHIAKAQKRNLQETMDICFGALENNAKQLVLCECRFNYKNVNNLSKSKLDAKILHSKELAGKEMGIHQYFVFLFKVGVKQQAYSKLRRLYSNKNIFKVLDIDEFKQTYFNS